MEQYCLKLMTMSSAIYLLLYFYNIVFQFLYLLNLIFMSIALNYTNDERKNDVTLFAKLFTLLIKIDFSKLFLFDIIRTFQLTFMKIYSRCICDIDVIIRRSCWTFLIKLSVFFV